MGEIKNNIYKSSSPCDSSISFHRLLPVFVMGAVLQAGSELRAEEAKPWGQINDYLRVTGEFQGSYEAWNFFQPSSVNSNNEYDLWTLRARLGLQLNTSIVDAYAQAQYNGLYGLPNNAAAAPPVGALGLGGAYFLANQSTDPSNVFLKQAHLNFKGNAFGLPGTQLKVGRFEYMDGLEYKSGDVKFDGLKSKRVAQRLVGSHIVHVGRSFDGFSMVYDQPGFNITASGLRPTQGGFTVQGQDEISKIDLFYTALTSKRNALMPGTEARLFYLFYNDDRNTQVVDNRPVINRPSLDKQDLNLHTVGTHLLTLQPLGSGSIDGLLWGAYQFGDWTNLDQQAWAVDAEVGYQWTKLPLKPWLRAIYYLSSGDDNPTDSKHKTFFTALPSPRTYAKFPYYNMMNLQDAFVQMIVSPTDKIKVAIDFHHLELANSSDLFYSGPGATSRSGSFGYSGRPSGGSTDIGQLIDINFTHNLTKEFSWTIYYGHAFGGNVIQNVYSKQKDADTAHVDFNLVF